MPQKYYIVIPSGVPPTHFLKTPWMAYVGWDTCVCMGIGVDAEWLREVCVLFENRKSSNFCAEVIKKGRERCLQGGGVSQVATNVLRLEKGFGPAELYQTQK